MKARKILKYIMLVLTITVNIFIIVNGNIKGPQSSQLSNGVADMVLPVINNITEGAIKTEPQVVAYHSVFRKLVGHFGLFVFSGVITTITVYLFLYDLNVKNHLFIMLYSFIMGLVVALISEFLQMYTSGRTASAGDVLLDTAGYVLGILFIIFCLLLMKKDIFKINRKKEA